MAKRIMVGLLAVLFAFSMAGLTIAADKAKGTIKAVGDGGKTITVQTDSGEKTFKVSSKRTKFKGISSRDELKEGQNVSVTYEGEDAQQISVK